MIQIASHLMILIVLWAGIYFNYICYSIIAPFFPKLATEKGLTAEQYSLVFSAYSFSQIISSCLVKQCINETGKRFVVGAGFFLTGASTVLFGCLEKCKDGAAFFILSIAIRITEGAGFAFSFSAALSVIIELYPNNPGYFVGLTETVVTLGMITGPPLGSVLYVIGGYHLPFTIFGVLIILSSIVVLIIVKEDKDETMAENKLTFLHYLSLLRLWELWMAIVCITLNVVADSFIMITLSAHLQQFHLKITEIGSIYLCLFISYGVSSPVAGRLADKFGQEHLIQCVGSLVVSTSFILIGPASFLHLKPRLWLIITGLICKGIGAGPLISCSYTTCLRAVRAETKHSNDLQICTLISSLLSFSISLGSLVGGSTAGILYDRVGMSISSTMYSAIFVILALLCLIMAMATKLKSKSIFHFFKSPKHQFETKENVYLLQSYNSTKTCSYITLEK